MTKVYCLKCKENRNWNQKPKLVKTHKGRYGLYGKCIKCNNNMFRSIALKDVQNGSGLLSMLGIKTPLAKIPLIGDILF